MRASSNNRNIWLLVVILAVLALSVYLFWSGRADAPSGNANGTYQGDPANHPALSVVASFYNDWIAASNPIAGSSPIDKGLHRTSSYVTEALTVRIENRLAGMTMGGYDPVLCAQDIPIDFRVVWGSQEEGTVHALVVADYYGTSRVIDVSLVPVADAWFINDIRCEDPAGEARFIEEGNLTINTPGSQAGVWHLIYDAPGAPGLSAKLRFDGESLCQGFDENTQSTCDTRRFSKGMRVQIVGTLDADEHILVESLTRVESDAI